MKPLFSLLLILLLFSCSKKENVEKKFHNPYYDLAKKYRDSGKPDSAFIQFNQAKEFGLQNRDSLSIASSLINMAILLTNAGDYFGGQEISIEANKYLNEGDTGHHYYLGSNYNNLGIATYNLKDYNNSLRLYDSAIKFSDDSLDTRMYLNNKAKVYQEIKDYKSALKIYDQILAKTAKNEKEYARVLTNIANTKWLENSQYNPVPDFLKSLQIRKKENDLWGQNSSYAHLSDYYTLKQPDTALFYAQNMYNVAQTLKSAPDQIEALQKLIKLSPAKETKYFFNVYEKINDSLQNARNASKNQFALIRYDTEKSKADNLVLQKDNEEKKYQVIILAFGLLLLAGTGTLWYRKRKQKLELAAKNSIRDSQLKTSKKVHDKVANKIYRVMSEVENKNDLDRNNLLDQLEYIYNTSRDISYEITDNQLNKTFRQQLSDLFSAYVASTRSIDVIGNEDEVWVNVPENTASEIFIILLELMNNMKKHSQATVVKIKFNKNHNLISINYYDNGIGFPEKVIYNNGLRNTETRIKNISGTITFETMDKNGLEILISFPIH
ncbi:tetratricopeptide repeat-containing sensor histidine kinase [Pedobacter borealis]|uniref:ATP-binding protein n=1 Tax=Pedobacter borealis TaxID=475254 RepID=UPI001FD7D798|nr:tetratricopeptide repeat-containing sensor histidine kinase [Pedobacter borealis]